VSRKAPAIALALLGGALWGGCSKRDDPVTAYNALATSVEKGEYPKAYEALSAPTKQVLEARARQLSTDSDGGVRDDPAALFISANGQSPAPEEVRLVRSDGGRAVLSVRSPKGEREVVMVKEASGWKLDLTDALHE
jgi:hypothetical protein